MNSDFLKEDSAKDSLIAENTQLEATINEATNNNAQKPLQQYYPSMVGRVCLKCAMYIVLFDFLIRICNIDGFPVKLADCIDSINSILSIVPTWLLQTIFEIIFIVVYVVLIKVNKHRWGLRAVNICLQTLVYARVIGVLCTVLVGTIDMGASWTKMLLLFQMTTVVVVWISNITTAIILLYKKMDIRFSVVMLISTIVTIVSDIYIVYSILNNNIVMLWDFYMILDDQLTTWLHVIFLVRFVVQELCLNSIKEDLIA